MIKYTRYEGKGLPHERVKFIQYEIHASENHPVDKQLIIQLTEQNNYLDIFFREMDQHGILWSRPIRTIDDVSKIHAQFSDLLMEYADSVSQAENKKALVVDKEVFCGYILPRMQEVA